VPRLDQTRDEKGSDVTCPPNDNDSHTVQNI
jgi:hypothetical protein